MISMIVVDYKSLNKTYQYMKGFSENCKNKSEIHYIIVDNCPSQENFSFLANQFELLDKGNIQKKEYFIYQTSFGELCYINAGGNLGYAKGNNLGALLSKHKYNDEIIIVSNNDLKLTKGFDSNSYNRIFSNDDSIAMIGPKIIGLDNDVQSPYKKVSPSYLLFIYPWTRFWPIKSKCDLSPMESSGYCYRVMGCFLVIKAKPFFECGMFDENTFMYCEEVIMSERLQEKGYHVYYFNDDTIIHEHGTTVKSTTGTLVSDKWLWDSLFYYCRGYRRMNRFLVGLAEVNRRFNYGVVLIKELIKRVFVNQKEGI